ncbi:flavin-containing monooxygenase [Williamsia sterculiae]|uniref:flavin-containing monooxygenase n=1 Tax=Williamsia sterculiae TaxID=1344003 RepID=UPI00097105D4|nr:NAD(P)/FAD-dependent oxidoreductase [Williamsia sterculiae]
MTTAAPNEASAPIIERDVLIVGAGLSGVAAAYRVHEACPGLTYSLLERRERVGGTWDLFRYPGIRSDSDIFTFSLPFSPWHGNQTIAEGADIRQYIADSADTFGISDHIVFGTKVNSANWDSTTDLWTVEAVTDGAPVTYSARFVFLCTGYYDYDGGYSPDFPGIENFGGTVVHPQRWPEDLDYADKKVVIIGSGATAVTLVPAMSPDAASVTMLQRSPTYIMSIPKVDPLTVVAQKLLPQKLSHAVNRWRNAAILVGTYQFCQRAPKLSRRIIRTVTKKQLPAGYEIDVHFKPKYNPWDQRLCVVPNGDLFKAIRSGKAEVVTDHIDHITENGVALTSGRELDADILITATGLSVQSFGGITIHKDGQPLKPNDVFVYKGHMLEGLPNIAWTIGYTNASWTLKADLTARAVARLLAYMTENGYTHAYPDRGDKEIEEQPVLNLQSGYIQRSLDQLPKSGVAKPWVVRQNYFLDYLDFLRDSLTESMSFGTVAAQPKKIDTATDTAEARQLSDVG